MAKSNLLKEAIADAKAVRETAIANAKIALEEAFTPRLQSILSQKLQQEMEDEESEEDVNEEYGAEDAPTGQSSSIGAGENKDGSGENNKQPSGDATQAHTELGADTDKETAAVGSEADEVEVVKEGEGEDENGDGVIDDPTGASVTEEEDYEEEEDDLDLESIIRELEAEIGDEEGEDEVSDEEEDAIEAEVEDEVEDHEDEFHGDGEAEDSAEAEVEDEVEERSEEREVMEYDSSIRGTEEGDVSQYEEEQGSELDGNDDVDDAMIELMDSSGDIDGSALYGHLDVTSSSEGGYDYSVEANDDTEL